MKLLPRWINPTALCEAHEAIHKARPFGKGAASAIRRLRGFWPALKLLPKGNIYIRHHLTLSALYLELGDIVAFHHHHELALSAMRRLCSPALPYIEGWSYLLYPKQAYRYWSLTCGASSEWEDIFEAQEGLAADAALEDGKVPWTDTSAGDTVTPTEDPFVTCPAFTRWKTPEGTVLVHHDVRVMNHRWNLHVEDTFGKVVRKASDWTWYEGWPKKRLSLWWRIFPREVRVLSRGYFGVELLIDGEKITIRP